MSLRIISGQFKGRRIPSPASPSTRPSTDMWRMAVFSALHQYVEMEGARVLDLYAGTGALGLECMSRGAAYCTFVERDAKACTQIQQTAHALSISAQCSVVHLRVESFLEQHANHSTGADVHQQSRRAELVKTTLVLADPPYDLRVGNMLISKLEKVCEIGCLLVYEHGTTEALLPSAGWEVLWSKESSVTVIDILRRLR